MLDELRAGIPHRRETAKLFLIWKALQLRKERPNAFIGAYEPLDAGPDVCAFTRSSAILIAVPLRPGAHLDPPAGTHDAFAGADLGAHLHTL